MSSTLVLDAYNPGKYFIKNPRSFSSSVVPNPAHGNTLRPHAGDDWGTGRLADIGIPAAADGVVVINTQNPGGYGYYLVIEHTREDGSKFRTLYAHMAEASSYKVGDTIAAGATIGEAGSTGGSTGIHLHFEVINGGGKTLPSSITGRFDPAAFDNWGGISHVVGTDKNGNYLIAQSSGLVSNGTYARTVEKIDKNTGDVIDTYVDHTVALDDGAGHLTGFQITTQAGDGTPYIISTVTATGELARQTFIGDNGNSVSFVQGGIRVDVLDGGQRVAHVPGVEGGIPVSPDGEIRFNTPGGEVEITLPGNALGNIVVYAHGEYYAFSSSATVYASGNSVVIQETGGFTASDTLINRDSAIRFNYQRQPGGKPNDSLSFPESETGSDWPEPDNSPFQHGADADDGIWFLQSTETIHLAYNGTGTMSDVPNSLIGVTTTPTQSTTQNGTTDPTQATSADNSTLIDTCTYEVDGVGNVNTATGNQNVANAIVTGGVRPGAQTVRLFDSIPPGEDFDPEFDFGMAPIVAAQVNQQATYTHDVLPVDPLVLDLNGDGVKLTSFAEAPVLFDIDHDRDPLTGLGTQELTGWVSAQDGIVVMDLNGNGQIDGIHEAMSEYFNGAVGTNGNAGEKRYANGFAALKSLDTNNDNQFTALDTAWNNVKVWVDANHDGKTDAGELRSLASLGISSINLAATTQSGLVNGGNEVLASGSFVINNQTREAQAARFIANPTGNTVTASATGTTVRAEDGQSTYISSLSTGETLDVAQKGVKNATGNSGNDVLIGDANANWLAGGLGADRFNAGAGDDVLLIDAADREIHAGAGFDLVQVVGNLGVTLNLAQSEVEVAIGGTGDDLFIGGGRSSVFVRAGDGDDIVLGGAANDALSGDNGADLIDGGAGNDLLRGGRGQDQLMGGSGDDLLFAGQDDDQLKGGAGNDVLKGEQGDDRLDGGDGIDIAEYAGRLGDYRITRLSESTWRVTDTQSGRDGADLLTAVEKLNFADVSAVDLTLDNPFPVNDVLTIPDRNGVKLIKVADLLANDRDWQGEALRLTTISDLKGGTIVGSYNATTREWTPTLTANGELQFTPDPAYTGVMSFKYKIADVDGTPGGNRLDPTSSPHQSKLLPRRFSRDGWQGWSAQSLTGGMNGLG